MQHHSVTGDSIGLVESLSMGLLFFTFTLILLHRTYLLCFNVIIADQFRNDDVLIELNAKTKMSARKFRQMLLYLRLYLKDLATESQVNNKRNPHYDSQHKVRPFNAALVRSFQKQIMPGRYLVIDESMTKCTSRCAHKTKMPRKPIKEGIKFYYLCDDLGCILNIDLHSKEVLPYDATRGPLFSRTFMLLTGQVPY